LINGYRMCSRLLLAVLKTRSYACTMHWHHWTIWYSKKHPLRWTR
jgi:hypothetical protein